MLRIFFSEPLPGVPHVVPLALACGVGRAGPPEPTLDRLFREAPALWRAADGPDHADLAVYSNVYDGSDGALRFVERAARSGLPCLLFDSSDNHSVPPPPSSAAVAWRTSLYADRLRPWERAMPPVCEDLLAHRAGRLELREKTATPSVGFCGYVSPRWKNAARLLRGEFEKVTGHAVRRRALRSFARSRRVRTDFIERPNYCGGALRAGWEPGVVNRVREQFVSNILDNDYTLCARGAGNFSIRFYETLSAGRVPVLVDTRCVLPLAGRIDWPRHCLIVDQRDIPRLPERLTAFHEALSPEAFRQMQQANRALWERWLEPLAFTRVAVEEALAGRHAGGARPAPPR